MEINKKYKYATLNREKVKAEVSVIEIEDVPGVGTDDVKCKKRRK